MLSSQLAHEPHGWLLQALAGSSGATNPTTNGADAKKLAALEKRVKRLEDRRAGGARTVVVTAFDAWRSVHFASGVSRPHAPGACDRVSSAVGPSKGRLNIG